VDDGTLELESDGRIIMVGDSILVHVFKESGASGIYAEQVSKAQIDLPQQDSSIWNA